MATIGGSCSLGRGYEFWLDVSETKGSNYISTNKTTVNVNAIFKNGNMRTNTNYWTYEIWINGSCALKWENQNFNTQVVNWGESFTVCSASLEVEHNADGSKSCPISVRLYKPNGSYGGYDPGECSASGNFGLTTIPRASAVSVGNGQVTLGNTATITCSRASNSFTHTVRIYDGSTLKQTITNVGASAAWTPSLGTYASSIPGTSKNFTVECETFNGGTSLGKKSCTVSLIVPNNENTKPTMVGGTFSHSEQDSTMQSLNWGVYVQSKSKLRFNLNPVTKASATPASGSIGIDGNTYSGSWNGSTIPITMSKALSSAGTLSVTSNVVDSRGFKQLDSGSYPLTSITVYKYSTQSFTANPTVTRCDVNGNPSDEGTYLRFSFSGKVSAVRVGNTDKNSFNFKVKWKKKSVSAWNEISLSGSATYDSSSDSYVLNVSNQILTQDGNKVTFDLAADYNVRFEIIDSFSTVPYDTEINVGGDLLNFNSNGHSLGIGQLSTAGPNDYLLEVAYELLLKKMPKVNGTSLLDLLHPVGSLYFSKTDDTAAKVKARFGGSWSQVKDRMIIGAGGSYAVATNYGASTVTLAAKHLPKHTHTVNIYTDWQGAHNHNAWFLECRWANNYSGSKDFARGAGSGGDYNKQITNDGAGNHRHLVNGNTGDGGFANNSFSIIPPCRGYYIWERTA